jgi:hypothetical protein
MSCQSVQKSLSAFLDRALPREEAEHVSRHLVLCRDCDARSKELMELRSLLRNLPVSPVPAKLASQLSVLASHERVRRGAGRWLHSWEALQLAMDNLMRPVAIPFAGGVIMAILAFSLITPPLTIRAADASTDVPFSWWSTQGGMVDTPPFSFQGDETEVVLTIDENGQITDYSGVQGKISRETIDNIGNSLLFSRFDPPTMFGKPISGKIRVKFSKSGQTIQVRG